MPKPGSPARECESGKSGDGLTDINCVMSRQPGWIVRRRERVRERDANAVDEWLQKNIQAFEQVETREGIPAASHAIEMVTGIWVWLPLLPFIVAFLVRGPLQIALLALVVLVSFARAAATRGYYIAVTDRRVLLQRLKRERGKPVGSVVAYPRRNVSVRRFKPAKNRAPYATLDLSIQDPAGVRKMTLSFYRLVWERNAESVKQALEQQGPAFGSDQA